MKAKLYCLLIKVELSHNANSVALRWDTLVYFAFNNTISRGTTLMTGASRGQCNSPGGGSPCTTRYSYPLASVNIAPFTSSSRAATPATHAITRLACSPEVKSRPCGKFTNAQIQYFPLFRRHTSHFPRYYPV